MWKRKENYKFFLSMLVILGLVTTIAVSMLQNGIMGGDRATCGSELRRANAVYQEQDVVFRNGDVTSSKAAITCNVDWGEEVLPDMLKTLGEADVKVTFFVTGKWVEKNPKLLRKMYLEGHQIESHGYGHKLCSKVGEREIRMEIEKTQVAIEHILGIKPHIFAPPSGDYDARTVEICRDLKYKISLWSADTIDWRQGSTASVIKERILKKELSGAIILMHPKPETAKALPQLLQEIKKRGIQPVTLEELGIR